MRPRVRPENRHEIPPGKRNDPASGIRIQVAENVFRAGGVLETHLLIHVEKIAKVESRGEEGVDYAKESLSACEGCGGLVD